MRGEKVLDILNKYGSDIEVINNSIENSVPKKKSKAFIQPLRYQDQNFMGMKFLDSGILNGANYLYIGSYDLRLDLYPINNTIIKTSIDSFVLKRAQKVCLKNDILYIWAILQHYVEEGI